jgi:hypothetical protein
MRTITARDYIEFLKERVEKINIDSHRYDNFYLEKRFKRKRVKELARLFLCNQNPVLCFNYFLTITKGENMVKDMCAALRISGRCVRCIVTNNIFYEGNFLNNELRNKCQLILV